MRKNAGGSKGSIGSGGRRILQAKPKFGQESRMVLRSIERSQKIRDIQLIQFWNNRTKGAIAFDGIIMMDNLSISRTLTHHKILVHRLS